MARVPSTPKPPTQKPDAKPDITVSAGGESPATSPDEEKKSYLTKAKENISKELKDEFYRYFGLNPPRDKKDPVKKAEETAEEKKNEDLDKQIKDKSGATRLDRKVDALGIYTRRNYQEIIDLKRRVSGIENSLMNLNRNISDNNSNIGKKNNDGSGGGLDLGLDVGLGGPGGGKKEQSKPKPKGGGRLSRLGNIGGRAVPLLGAGIEGYREYQETGSAGRAAAVGGGTLAGGAAGAKAGAVIGAFGGPVGAAIGGIVGGIGGAALGSFATRGVLDAASQPANTQDAQKALQDSSLRSQRASGLKPGELSDDEKKQWQSLPSEIKNQFKNNPTAWKAAGKPGSSSSRTWMVTADTLLQRDRNWDSFVYSQDDLRTAAKQLTDRKVPTTSQLSVDQNRLESLARKIAQERKTGVTEPDNEEAQTPTSSSEKSWEQYLKESNNDPVLATQKRLMDRQIKRNNSSSADSSTATTGSRTWSSMVAMELTIPRNWESFPYSQDDLRAAAQQLTDRGIQTSSQSSLDKSRLESLARKIAQERKSSSATMGDASPVMSATQQPDASSTQDTAERVERQEDAKKLSREEVYVRTDSKIEYESNDRIILTTKTDMELKAPNGVLKIDAEQIEFVQQGYVLDSNGLRKVEEASQQQQGAATPSAGPSPVTPSGGGGGGGGGTGPSTMEGFMPPSAPSAGSSGGTATPSAEPSAVTPSGRRQSEAPSTTPQGIARGDRAGLNERSKLVDYSSDKSTNALGIDQRQYNSFREALAGIESRGGEYGIIGGAGNHYSGAYQFGRAAMTDTARALKMPVPSREEFLKNPQLQEQFLDQYTSLNHRTLMRVSPQYREMTPEQRLGVLGYAHNQGAGGAAKWLKTGVVGKDAFGTAGTKYTSAIQAQLGRTKGEIVGGTSEAATSQPSASTATPVAPPSETPAGPPASATPAGPPAPATPAPPSTGGQQNRTPTGLAGTGGPGFEITKAGFIRSSNASLRGSAQNARRDEECATLGKAFNPKAGTAGSWRVDVDHSKIQPGVMIATTSYNDGSGGRRGATYHTAMALSTPDKNGNIQVLEQFRGQPARIKTHNVNNYKGVPYGVVRGATQPSLAALEVARSIAERNKDRATMAMLDNNIQALKATHTPDQLAKTNTAQVGMQFGSDAKDAADKAQTDQVAMKQATSSILSGTDKEKALASIRQGLPEGASPEAKAARERLLQAEASLRTFDPTNKMLPENQGDATKVERAAPEEATPGFEGAAGNILGDAVTNEKAMEAVRAATDTASSTAMGAGMESGEDLNAIPDSEQRIQRQYDAIRQSADDNAGYVGEAGKMFEDAVKNAPPSTAVPMSETEKAMAAVRASPDTASSAAMGFGEGGENLNVTSAEEQKIQSRYNITRDNADSDAGYTGQAGEMVQSEVEKVRLEERQAETRKRESEVESAREGALAATAPREGGPTAGGNNPESSPPSPGNNGYGSQKDNSDMPSICTI